MCSAHPAPSPEDDPLVAEMFAQDGEDGGIDDFDLSQLRSRPITSDGRAGISRDVSEYVERLEATSERGSRRGRRRRVYGDEGVQTEGEAPVYAEMGEEAPAEGEEEYADYAQVRGTRSLAVKIAGIVVALAIVAGGVWLLVSRMGDIQDTAASPIAGVSASLYEQGLDLINQHQDNSYVQTLLTQGQEEGALVMQGSLSADTQAINDLLG